MNLLALQRNFMGWLRTEDGGLADALGGGPGPAIYLNNHRASLLASLAGSYPQLLRWIGQDAFDAAAARHVDETGPSHWSLDRYGANFGRTLAQVYPDDHELPGLAQLEWALGEAFVAADAEPLVVVDLGAVDWDNALLRLVPSARLLCLDSNADAILSALTMDTEPPAATECKATIILWRQESAPRFRQVTVEEALLLAQMAEGIRFADICAWLAARDGEAEGIRKAGAYLADWAVNGLCRRP